MADFKTGYQGTGGNMTFFFEFLSGMEDVDETMTWQQYLAATPGDMYFDPDNHHGFGYSEGETRSVAGTSYKKSWHFYSGSVIDKNTFAAQGFQANFDWRSHAFVYAQQTTTYSVTETYTLVGESNETTHGFNSTEYSLEPDLVYDWVTTEHSPTVALTAEGHSLYVTPRSAGIIAEIDTEGTDTTLYFAEDSRSHEELFTDNSDISLYHGYSSGGLISHVSGSVSSDEAAFIKDLFDEGDGTPASTLIEAQITNLALQIYNSALISKNIYTISDAPRITERSLREIAGMETLYLANLEAPDPLSATAEVMSVTEADSGFGGSDYSTSGT